MWLIFIYTNLHFAVNLFASLVFFAVFWLYFDAWLSRKNFPGFGKFFGFLLLALSSLFHSVQVETALISQRFLPSEFAVGASYYLEFAAFAFLIVGLLREPIENRPKITEQGVSAGILAIEGIAASLWARPFLAVLVAILYLRRAFFGLERHLIPVVWAFGFLTLGNFLHIASTFRESSNVGIYNLVRPFGTMWIIEHALILVGILILRTWVFKYLLRRFLTQLFMILTTSIVVIFLITTVTFTGLLLKNIQEETLAQLETDVKVLSFAVESKKAEVLADSQLLAQNAQVATGVGELRRTDLAALAEEYLLTKKQSSIAIVDAGGKVLARAEDRERIGDSLSSDPLVSRAIAGEAVSSAVVLEGVFAPEISVSAAAPITKDGSVIGATLVREAIDAAFVEGINRATGLTFAIYGGDVLSVSSLSAGFVGTVENDKRVISEVLGEGKTYVGAVSKFNTDYFAAYLPIKNLANIPVGMLLVGRGQVLVFETAARSIELTFLVAGMMLLLMILPSYFMARYISRQLK